MKFRKKPVVINAESAHALWHFMRDNWAAEMHVDFWSACEDGRIVANDDGTLTIRTLEGDMTAQPSDWIIRGVHGEFYPCKPEIFEQTYEVV